MATECTKAHGPTQHDGGAVDGSINQLATEVEKSRGQKNKTRECKGEVRPLDAPDGEEDEPLLPSRSAAHRLGGSAHQRQAVARHRSLATARAPPIASTWDARGAMVEQGWGGAVCSLPKTLGGGRGRGRARSLLAFRGVPNIGVLVEYSTKRFPASSCQCLLSIPTLN